MCTCVCACMRTRICLLTVQNVSIVRSLDGHIQASHGIWPIAATIIMYAEATCHCWVATLPTFHYLYYHKRQLYALHFKALIPYCPTVTPPLFATYCQEKEGGGRRNNKDFRFCLAVKPPPPLLRIRILRSMKLCCAVEDENSFDRHAVAVLKDGRVVRHVHVAIFSKT